MKRLVTVAVLAVALASCHIFSPSPNLPADEQKLRDDWNQLQIDAPAVLAAVPEFVALAGDIAAGDYPAAVVEVLQLIPQINAAGGPVLADVRAIIADLERIVGDVTAKKALAKANAKLRRP